MSIIGCRANTDTPLDEFGRYILLTNFDDYLHMFSEWNAVPIHGAGMPMPNATAQGITLINFGMGSANAATIMDLLSAIKPKACLFLGKCGGLKRKNKVGDLILPIAANPAAKAPPTIIFRPKSPPCPPSIYKKPSRPPFATMTGTIGQVRFTPPIAASGNTMRRLRLTCAASASWPSTWKRPPCLPPVSITGFQSGPCSWSPTSP